MAHRNTDERSAMQIHSTTELIDLGGGAPRIPVQVYQGTVARPAEVW